MSATEIKTSATIPAGTYRLDPVHSSVGFAVKHMVVSTFRGRFENFDATLTVDEDGSAAPRPAPSSVDSIDVKDENLAAHLGVAGVLRHRAPSGDPLRGLARSMRDDDGALIVDGELTIKGQTHPLEATRHDHRAGRHVRRRRSSSASTLETVIDRTQYGLNWNAPLPKGGFALANDVKLTVELELAREEA